ncbi:Acyl-CoA:lysophosphatidylglycerol acyltransferase 1 [Armadillidium vulgare]|nr:Acyl-CoA:lysophosphatidylglycerol acyltransferase 1 [Armadillidium vulgare]
MDFKTIWKTLQTIIRFVFVFVNNLYCIPVHVVWLFFLFPLRWVSEGLYWHIEGIFFHWLLSMVALWSYSAGYHIRELGDDGKEHRDASLEALANHMEDFYMKRNRKWIVLFPEGGFLKNRKATSQRFAEKNNLPHLENVSLPRVGALKIILEEVGISTEKKTLKRGKVLGRRKLLHTQMESLWIFKL